MVVELGVMETEVLLVALAVISLPPDVVPIFPVPLLKTGVSVVEDPLVIDAAPAVRDVAIGAGVENPPPVSPPPPPPPHATKKAKTMPRLRGRRNLKNRIGAPIN